MQIITCLILEFLCRKAFDFCRLSLGLVDEFTHYLLICASDSFQPSRFVRFGIENKCIDSPANTVHPTNKKLFTNSLNKFLNKKSMHCKTFKDTQCKKTKTKIHTARRPTEQFYRLLFILKAVGRLSCFQIDFVLFYLVKFILQLCCACRAFFHKLGLRYCWLLLPDMIIYLWRWMLCNSREGCISRWGLLDHFFTFLPNLGAVWAFKPKRYNFSSCKLKGILNYDHTTVKLAIYCSHSKNHHLPSFWAGIWQSECIRAWSDPCE